MNWPTVSVLNMIANNTQLSPSLFLSLQHMCSLESELESQMGEFHVKMKGESLSTLMWLPIPTISPVLIFSVDSWCFRSCWLCTALCWWPVWGKKHKFKHIDTDFECLSPLRHTCLCLHQVLMRYGRQRWRLRGRVEVSNKQIWDSEEYIFLPLITELLSIKVMKSAVKGQD